MKTQTKTILIVIFVVIILFVAFLIIRRRIKNKKQEESSETGGDETKLSITPEQTITDGMKLDIPERNPLITDLSKITKSSLIDTEESPLRVREKPRPDANVITKLAKGTIVVIYDIKGYWYKIGTPAGYGWAYYTFIKT